MDRLLERFLSSVVRRGCLTVTSHTGRSITVGDGTGRPLRLTFLGRSAEWRMMRDPALAFGELYMERQIGLEGGDIYDFLELGMRNYAAFDMSRWLKTLDNLRFLVRGLRPANDAGRSRANVAHHYDLDGRLYRLFLDDDMQYSCAYFERPDMSLEEAQRAKKRHIAAKLLVEPGQSTLDIGCGWGGLGLYIAQTCGARVQGVTLSTEQLDVARQRASERNLEQIAFDLRDYRLVEDRFDRIVSVGMLEHVGAVNLDAYFKQVAKLLNEDGVALIHTIGRPEGPGVTNPWIAKYIFPGGYIPALSEISRAIERAGLLVTDIECLHLHYAETLKAWRARFLARRDEAKALYDERFCRMWDFYLAASEAGFRLGQQLVYQFQLVKREGVVPITRDYIARREQALRLREQEGPRLRIAGE